MRANSRAQPPGALEPLHISQWKARRSNNPIQYYVPGERERWNAVVGTFCEVYIHAMHTLALQVFERFNLSLFVNPAIVCLQKRS